MLDGRCDYARWIITSIIQESNLYCLSYLLRYFLNLITATLLIPLYSIRRVSAEAEAEAEVNEVK
jgi:hypothetical protein